MDKLNIDRLSIIALYRPHLKRYISVIVGAVVVILILSFLLPHKYVAVTTLMPPEEKSSTSGLSALLSAAPITSALGGSENKSALTFIELLKSRSLIEGIVDTLSLDSNEFFAGKTKSQIVKLLKENIYSEAKKSGLITIEASLSTNWLPFQYEKESAKLLSADLGNACVKVLDRMNREKSVSQARNSRLYIERVLHATRLQIDSIQDSLKAFQKANKVLALEEQVAAIVGNAVSVGSELAKAEIELNMVKHDFQASSPQVVMMENQVATLREQYNKVQQGGLVSADGFSIPLTDIPGLTKTYTNLIRDLKIKEQLNAYLESQRMQELIQEAKDVPTVLTLDSALPPLSQDSPSRVAMSLLAIITITVLFLIGIPVLEVRKQHKQNNAA